MGKNFNGTQINNSATIVEKAGAAITDCRNKILKYDENGDVVLATSGKDIPIGVALSRQDATILQEQSPARCPSEMIWIFL